MKVFDFIGYQLISFHRFILLSTKAFLSKIISHQKSFGVPIHVSGVRMIATATIHQQSERWTPAHVERMEPNSWEINTMKTQPPPYRVRLMHSRESFLEKEF